jgi:hypothetical protein
MCNKSFKKIIKKIIKNYKKIIKKIIKNYKKIIKHVKYKNNTKKITLKVNKLVFYTSINCILHRSKSRTFDVNYLLVYLYVRMYVF